MANPNLPALAGKIKRVLSIKPEYFVTHPAELYVLRSLSEAELADFTRNHGWRMVRRVGGRQLEFYNDVAVKQEASGSQPP